MMSQQNLLQFKTEKSFGWDNNFYFAADVAVCTGILGIIKSYFGVPI